jgi:carboxyl-terminal processing protease
MPNDGEMTLTWSRFYSPSGYALHGLGVLPTVCTADDHAEPAALLAALSSGQTSFAPNVAAWRTASVDQQDLREHLRALCPAARHAGATRDVEVARELIADHGLYARALDLSGPVSTVSTTPTPSIGDSLSRISP